MTERQRKVFLVLSSPTAYEAVVVAEDEADAVVQCERDVAARGWVLHATEVNPNVGASRVILSREWKPWAKS